MFKKFKNEIDRLREANKRLSILKDKISNTKDERNSAIETKIKRLENKSWRNQRVAEAKIKTIERQIKKNKELIATERKYYLEDNKD